MCHCVRWGKEVTARRCSRGYVGFCEAVFTICPSLQGWTQLPCSCCDCDFRPAVTVRGTAVRQSPHPIVSSVFLFVTSSLQSLSPAPPKSVVTAVDSDTPTFYDQSLSAVLMMSVHHMCPSLFPRAALIDNSRYWSMLIYDRPFRASQYDEVTIT